MPGVLWRSIQPGLQESTSVLRGVSTSRQVQLAMCSYKGSTMCKIFSFLFLLCISISADMVVIVDWANVRENPGTDARRIAQLPFGTWVKTTEVINGWAHIKIVENQEILGNVSGWVSSSLLKEMEPSSFLREIENYRTSDSLELLLRCAVSSDSCAAALHKYYTERNDQRGLAKWRELYDSTFFRPAYIAIRDCDQMRVIGFLDSTGSFTSLEMVSESEYSSEENLIRGHIPDIRQKKWYVVQSGFHKNRSFFFAPASDWIDVVDLDRCSYGLTPPVGINLGSFRESYQKEKYSVLSSEPMAAYLSEAASYTQSNSQDVHIILKIIHRYFRTGEADTAASLIKSYSVTSLPFGYREVTLRGDLNPFSRALTVDNIEVYPQFAPAFTFGYEQSFGQVLSVSAGLGIRFAASRLAVGQNYTTRMYGETSHGTLDISVVHEFTNLVLPIDFKFMFPTRSGGVFFALGPEVSYLLAAKRTDDVKNSFDPDNSIHTTADIRDDYAAVGIGVGFRLGWEKRIGNHNLLLQTGYTGGLNDMSKDEIITMKNMEFSILELGFRFNTGR